MKRYLLFVGDRYYPVGGAADFFGDFETEEEAWKVLETFASDRDYGSDWANLLDAHSDDPAEAVVGKWWRIRDEWLTEEDYVRSINASSSAAT